MSARKYLGGDVLLLGESDGAAFRRRFVITKRLGRGGSAVCYEAYHSSSGKGTLREFYPTELYMLERTSDGQLVIPEKYPAERKRFEELRGEYLEPYKMLLEAKRSGESGDLSTFIPEFEIYTGCGAEGEPIGTTYIWTPAPKLETFESLCRDIHLHPRKKPEQKLLTVLSAVRSLTKCVCALHSASLVHRDINPSNFGFLRRGDETLTETVSLFDVNSVCSVYAKNLPAVLTEGFSEPGIKNLIPDCETDIYSLGATLFYAIIVTPETKENGYVYESGYYGRLRELTADSALISCSESNSHPRLRAALVKILERTLCPRGKRYKSCEELAADLDNALCYILPPEIAQKKLSGEKWVLADAQAALDKNRDRVSAEAIQYHLLRHPLYECATGTSEELNVLVIGLGRYGQVFLDNCLSLGQIRGKRLSVTVISDDVTDRGVYIDERPGLGDFFDIDEKETRDDSFGSISFRTVKLSADDRKGNASAMEDVMCSADAPNYIFIALGDDRLNLSAARACADAAELLEIKCAVSFVYSSAEQAKKLRALPANVFPVNTDEEIRRDKSYAELERMAYNTHLVWVKDKNLPQRAVRSEFLKPYNRSSCISSAIGLRYKLHMTDEASESTESAEAAFREGDFGGAALLFESAISSPSGKQLKNELSWLEHRRWVTEKLCLGWRGIDDLGECAAGITSPKDERKKRHICIIKSRPDQLLTTHFRVNNCEKWDTAPEAELNRLDDLDRVSVELHRLYAKKADEMRRYDLLSGDNMKSIGRLIDGYPAAEAAFHEWRACISDIMSGALGKVKLYKSLKNAFLDSAAECSEHSADTDARERLEAIRGNVSAVEILFNPILRSTEYFDYKQNNVKIINGIPFILTYTHDACLVIPFAVGDNSAVFGNVSAVITADPAHVIYLCSVDGKRSADALTAAVPRVVGYLEKRGCMAKLELIAVCEDKNARYADESFKNELTRLGGGAVRRVQVITGENPAVLAEKLEEHLAERRKAHKNFALECRGNMFSHLWGRFDTFTFREDEAKFTPISGCGFLAHINKRPYITVSDMTALRLSSGKSVNQPEFFEDHGELWRKYRSDSRLWKRMCNSLGEYADKNDVMASFGEVGERDKCAKAARFTYILPSACRESASKIVSRLMHDGVIGAESSIEGYTSDSCRVTVFDETRGNRAALDRVFSDVYALAFADSITAYKNTVSHATEIKCDRLSVNGVSFPEDCAAGCYALLGFFRDKGYISALTRSENGVSFTYGTRRIKSLLTNAGNILEVYTYHKARETGAFDDVVSGYEIEWEDAAVKNEFDCIATRGFRSLFIECKARGVIDAEYYFKLNELKNRFGINATAVLIADTQEKVGGDCAEANELQRRRGELMDMVTVWRKEDIDNIGQTLIKIIKGEFEGE